MPGTKPWEPMGPAGLTPSTRNSSPRSVMRSRVGKQFSQDVFHARHHFRIREGVRGVEPGAGRAEVLRDRPRAGRGSGSRQDVTDNWDKMSALDRRMWNLDNEKKAGEGPHACGQAHYEGLEGIGKAKRHGDAVSLTSNDVPGVYQELRSALHRDGPRQGVPLHPDLLQHQLEWWADHERTHPHVTVPPGSGRSTDRLGVGAPAFGWPSVIHALAHRDDGRGHGSSSRGRRRQSAISQAPSPLLSGLA